MKANAGLQIIFAFFLGLVVVAFVGIGVNTFYPQPEYLMYGGDDTGAAWEAAYDHWALVTGGLLLLFATAVWPSRCSCPSIRRCSNGILLGGVFYGLRGGDGVRRRHRPLRFGVATVALAVTIAGYLKFVRAPRCRRPDAARARAMSNSAPASPPSVKLDVSVRCASEPGGRRRRAPDVKPDIAECRDIPTSSLMVARRAADLQLGGHPGCAAAASGRSAARAGIARPGRRRQPAVDGVSEMCRILATKVLS